MRFYLSFAVILLSASLAACDQIAELDGSRAAEAEGKATGGACRHAGRALEDCYILNERASRSAVFAGWREMNDYMTQNKIDPVAPTIPPPAKKTVGKYDDSAAAKPGGLPDPLASRYPSQPAVAAKDSQKATLPPAAGSVAGATVGGAVGAAGGLPSDKPGPVVGDASQAAAATPPALPAPTSGPRTPQETAAALFAPVVAAGTPVTKAVR